MTTPDLPAFLVLGNAATVDEARALLDLPEDWIGIHGPAGSDFRDPVQNLGIATRPPAGGSNPVTNWHQDAFLSAFDPVAVGRFILWSDTYPTEVRLPDGEVVRGRGGDAVLLDNRVVLHRVPLDYQKAARQNRAEPRHLIRVTGGSYVRQSIERYLGEQGS